MKVSPQKIRCDLLKLGYTMTEFANKKGFKYTHFYNSIQRHCNGKNGTEIKSYVVLNMLKELSIELGYSVNEYISLGEDEARVQTKDKKDKDVHFMFYK